jgi:hypothetical protein
VHSDHEKTFARRDLLKVAAGLTAVGALVGVPAVVFHQAGGDASNAEAADEGLLDLEQPLVAYIQDASNGEVVIMSGVEQVVVTDRDLVARLVAVGRV